MFVFSQDVYIFTTCSLLFLFLLSIFYKRRWCLWRSTINYSYTVIICKNHRLGSITHCILHSGNSKRTAINQFRFVWYCLKLCGIFWWVIWHFGSIRTWQHWLTDKAAHRLQKHWFRQNIFHYIPSVRLQMYSPMFWFPEYLFAPTGGSKLQHSAPNETFSTMSPR